MSPLLNILLNDVNPYCFIYIINEMFFAQNAKKNAISEILFLIFLIKP